MYYELPEEVVAMKNMARKFAEKKLLPITEEDYEKGITRLEVIEDMGGMGFFGCLIPDEYGGSNAGYLSAVNIVEEIAKINASYAGYFMCQLAGPPLTILKYGTEEQKRMYIPEIISGKLIPHICCHRTRCRIRYFSNEGSWGSLH